MKTNLVLSIITVVYNDRNIENTIKSILPHLNDRTEYILIDGASKDGTKEIIEKYIDKIDFYLSEPDEGIYDAMNKAVSVAQGKYLLHLNSGDRLLSLPLELLLSENCDIISFPVSINNGETIYKPLFNYKTKFRTSLHHQGTFYKRELVNYNTIYRVFADFDLNQRLYKNGVVAKLYSAPVVAEHLENGISASMPKRRIEHSLIIRKNFGWVYYGIYYMYLIYKNLRQRRY